MHLNAPILFIHKKYLLSFSSSLNSLTIGDKWACNTPHLIVTMPLLLASSSESSNIRKSIILLFLHSCQNKTGSHFYPTRLAAKPPAGWVLRLFWITCVYMYIKTMFVRFGFPHHWLYKMLLTTRLRRGLTRTEK